MGIISKIYNAFTGFLHIIKAYIQLCDSKGEIICHFWNRRNCGRRESKRSREVNLSEQIMGEMGAVML